MESNSVVILFAEDNDSHAKLVMRSFEEHTIDNRVYHLRDGEAVMDFLLRRGQFSSPENAPRPDVLLLDLRLPKVDGLEVLRLVKEDPSLRKLPVVVLTTSDAESDISQAYELQANSYLVKPLDFEAFSEMMRDLGFYWLDMNQSPNV